MSRRWYLRLAVASAVLLAAITTAGQWMPWLLDTVASLQDAGPGGHALFAGVYAACTWLMLPASWLQGAAGFAYGPFPGYLVAWGLSTFFGAISYEISRGWLRDFVAARLGHGRLAAIDQAMVRRGLLAVILLRLSPFAPYNVVSYALGATGVSRGTFWLGTAIGSLFPAGVWTFVGASLSDLTALTSGEVTFGGARWAVLAATLIASVGIALFVKRALAEGLEPAPVPVRP